MLDYDNFSVNVTDPVTDEIYTVIMSDGKLSIDSTEYEKEDTADAIVYALARGLMQAQSENK